MSIPLESATASELLEWAAAEFGAGFAIVTSFQSEGMVLVDMASRLARKTPVLTIDTGRLPDETVRMIEEVEARYGIKVERIRPDDTEVARMVAMHGRDLFYEDMARRTLCCQVRKVRPLERRLQDFQAYAVGLRRGQSESRGDVEKVKRERERLKLSPLADWTKEQVEEYTRRFDVPRHPLYAQGYTSIGCGPCTRAVQPGEDERAGRWWWEQGTKKECGLHFTPDGRAARTVDVLLQEVLTATHG